MKNKLEIYPSHPYIAVVEGRFYHLNEGQYNAILEDMGDGKGTIIINYHDPKTAEDRKIPLNLYKLTELDKSEVVRENNWKIQKGWVCKDGRLVDSQEDCSGNEGFKQKETPGVGIDGIMHNAFRSMEARTSLIAGLFIGNARHKISEPRMVGKWKTWELDWDIIKSKINKYQQKPEQNPISETTREFALEAVNKFLTTN
tara:strand:- start:28192 stop:28791 length:600 start_codon:yes stop_codon:yes gene_type:complete